MQFSLICNVLVQQCLTEVIRTIRVLIWDSVKDHRPCSDSSCYTVSRLQPLSKVDNTVFEL